ncbi:glycosyltransferase family 1 protein [Arsukibacterium sp.]|uniref:glycosyltransferase family 1 protein n=1 Tax=Arsukibacterium sp. TaxID=1977258 RepID=UPI001BD4A186|nr:glycosyltransferase family 1 protein [Arsukibacterium sp.]
MAELSVTRILVVEERTNPSTDFFVAPELVALGGPVEYFNFVNPPKLATGEQVVLVFVRYVSKIWLRWVQQHRSQISKISYFMDDDLFDLAAFKGLPWRYQYKLTRLAFSRRQWLKAVGAELWVSTPYLQAKYQQWQPRLVQACSPAQSTEQLTMFYHGSASHRLEIAWLYPVVAEILQLLPQVSFEIIGGSEVNKRYRMLDRVHVLHPMSWPSYQALLARGGRDIGLAPLLAGNFNNARAYTKFFDISRAGGVGLYTEDSIYSEVVTDQTTGLLLPNKPDSWVAAVQMLVNEPDKRLAMQRAAAEKCEHIRALTCQS